MLLGGIDVKFVRALPTTNSPTAQLLSDLYQLKDAGRLADGSVPVETWLLNAARLAGARIEARAFRQALEALRARSPVAFTAPAPSYPDVETRLLSQQLEAARHRKRKLTDAGVVTSIIEDEILDLRRRLREGGRLRAGDSVGDGRYLLLEQVGEGGFASVWRARERGTETCVAVKVLHPNIAADPARRDRFFRGARVMAGLRHEAVVKVLEQRGEDGGFHYLVMEFVEGTDLRRAVLDRLLPEDEIIRTILRVGDALTEAHSRGIVHRDVKPSNILLDSARLPRLTDFDLVAAADTTGGTRTGALGTFIYSAPESLDRPQDADARADVFGLGMTMIFCLHGADLTMMAVRRTERLIEDLRCGSFIKAVLSTAVEWEAKRRFADAREFCEVLRDAASNQSLEAQLTGGSSTNASSISFVDLAAEADALGRMGSAYQGMGDWQRAISLYERQLALVRGLGNRAAEADALGRMGFVFQDMGDWQRAIELYEQQLTVVRELGNHAAQARVVGRLELVHQSMGDLRRAQELHKQQLVFAQASAYAANDVNRTNAVPSIAILKLAFHVTADEEHVRVVATDGVNAMDLGERTIFQLLYLLARERRSDSADAKLPEVDRGWVYVSDLLQNLHVSEQNLNVMIFRLRATFAKAGIASAESLLQRRGRQIRIGVGGTDITLQAS